MVIIRVRTNIPDWVDDATAERLRGIVQSAMLCPYVWGEPPSKVRTTPEKDGQMYITID